MGSHEFGYTSFRCGFAFIGVVGQHDSYDKSGNDIFDKVSVTQIFKLNGGTKIPIVPTGIKEWKRPWKGLKFLLVIPPAW